MPPVKILEFENTIFYLFWIYRNSNFEELQFWFIILKLQWATAVVYASFLIWIPGNLKFTRFLGGKFVQNAARTAMMTT